MAPNGWRKASRAQRRSTGERAVVTMSGQIPPKPDDRVPDEVGAA